MKKLLEKVMRPSKKPDMYLGFSGGRLKWVVSYGKTDTTGRIIVDDYGIIASFSAVTPDKFPKNFKTYLKKSKIHYILPVGTSVKNIVSDTISMEEVRDVAPEYAVHQDLLHTNNIESLYITTSINMDRITPDIELLKSKKINVAEVHHVSEGFITKNIGPDAIGAMYIVSIGEVFSWVAWISNGHVLYQQDIELGRQDLVRAIEKEVIVSTPEAQSILDKYGISRAHPDQRVPGVLYKILQPITNIMNEWVVSHSHFTYTKRSVQILPHMIFITGGGSNIVGIEQYLVLQTGIPTENIGTSLLRQYVTKHNGHVGDLREYEPLVNMIQKD